jgi:hypothetical protein
MNQIHSYQKALRELVKTGGVTDPDLAARIEAGWHPGIELAVMSVRPDLPDAIKTVILKVLLENTVVSATDKARLDAGVDSPTQINISIAGWAAGQREPSAVEVKPAAALLDYTQADRPQMHRTSPPQPGPTEPRYQEYDMVKDAGGVERPVAVEVPQSDFKPTRYRFDERTASYIEIVKEDDDA